MFKTQLTCPSSNLPLFQAAADAAETAIDVAAAEEDTIYTLTLFAETPEQQKTLEVHLVLASTMQNLPVPALIWENVAEENWHAKALRDFPPLEIEGFIILRNGEKDPNNFIALHIPANQAFGTGEHATTSGCLKLYNTLPKLPETILDMGCGSGILALAAAKKHGVASLCVDIDKDSVDICLENAALNGVSGLISATYGDGFKVVKGQSFELIFANILANPLIEMSCDLAACLAVDGYAILSGYLDTQKEAVHAAYDKQNLICVTVVQDGDWLASLWQKKDV